MDGGAETNYAVVASTKGYHGAGYFPVKVRGGEVTCVELMVLPKRYELNFSGAKWPEIQKHEPKLVQFFEKSVKTQAEAPKAYGELLEMNSKALACFLNVWEIFRDIRLAAGNPRDYLHSAVAIDKDNLRGDRFFAWCGKELVTQVEMAANLPARIFSPVPPPSTWHPGATRGFKEISHGQANLQICFHEDDRHPEKPDELVKTEFDVDYYKDQLAHFLLEVVPNHASGGISKPEYVYHLRWMASRMPGVTEFKPLYRILAAA